MEVFTLKGTDMSGARKRPDLTVLVADRLKDWMRDNPALDTQKKLAEFAGVGQTTVSRLLKKQVSPTLDVLDRICIAFGRDTEELIALPNAASIHYDRAAYAKLPDYEKVRVEGFIRHAIEQYTK